jgi:cell division protein ZapA
LSSRVELTLLGQTLTVRTEASDEYVRSLARYLEDRVTTLRKSGVQDPTKALLLAALDITDELFRARESQDKTAGDVGARLGALVALLEQATPRETPRG